MVRGFNPREFPEARGPPVRALPMMQAPMIILPLSFDPERLVANVEWDDDQTWISVAHSLLPSVLSFLVLVLLSFLTIRLSSQSFKNNRDKLLEAETIDPEETIQDLDAHAPYSAAFCLQYVPRGKPSYSLYIIPHNSNEHTILTPSLEYRHEEKVVLRKILWVFGTKAVQFFAVLYPGSGKVENLACARTAACSTALVVTNLWYMQYLLRRPYASPVRRASSVTP